MFAERPALDGCGYPGRGAGPAAGPTTLAAAGPTTLPAAGPTALPAAGAVGPAMIRALAPADDASSAIPDHASAGGAINFRRRGSDCGNLPANLAGRSVRRHVWPNRPGPDTQQH